MAPAGAQREGLCHRASQAAAVQIAAGRAAAARPPSGPATWGEAGRPLWLSAPGAPGCRSCCLKPTSRARQPLAPGWATAGELLSGQPPPASAGGCALTGKRFLFEEEQSWFAVAGVCHLNAEWDARAAQLGGLWLSGGVRRTFPWLSSALLHRKDQHATLRDIPVFLESAEHSWPGQDASLVEEGDASPRMALKVNYCPGSGGTWLGMQSTV